jgi:hypothetical protein
VVPGFGSRGSTPLRRSSSTSRAASRACARLGAAGAGFRQGLRAGQRPAPIEGDDGRERGVAMAVPFQRLRATCTPSTQGRRYSSRSLAMDGHPRAPEIHSITDS